MPFIAPSHIILYSCISTVCMRAVQSDSRELVWGVSGANPVRVHRGAWLCSHCPRTLLEITLYTTLSSAAKVSTCECHASKQVCCTLSAPIARGVCSFSYRRYLRRTVNFCSLVSLIASGCRFASDRLCCSEVNASIADFSLVRLAWPYCSHCECLLMCWWSY